MDIRSVAQRVLLDSRHYLDHIDQELYKRPLDLLFGATIGEHTRHFIEFYQCLMDQVDGPDPVVDYSLRLRDKRIEEQPEFAAALVLRLADSIADLDTGLDCQLRCSEHLHGEEVSVRSNVNRELLYNIEHTIHHLAIIKIGLAAIAPQLDLPSHFGVAPSTMAHKQGLCAQ